MEEIPAAYNVQTENKTSIKEWIYGYRAIDTMTPDKNDFISDSEVTKIYSPLTINETYFSLLLYYFFI